MGLVCASFQLKMLHANKQARCAFYSRYCDSKLLMTLRWEGGEEKESTTPLTTNLVGRVNSVTTSSDRHRSPFTDGTSNYPGLLFEVSRMGMEEQPQGGQFTLHAHYTSGDSAMSHSTTASLNGPPKCTTSCCWFKDSEQLCTYQQWLERWLDVVVLLGVKQMEAAGKQWLRGTEGHMVGETSHLAQSVRWPATEERRHRRGRSSMFQRKKTQILSNSLRNSGAESEQRR